VALAIDLSQASSILSFISSIALIFTALFFVLQLRQNAKLIEAQVRQTQATVAFSIVEKITHESFARRRSRMYENVKKYSHVNWQGFDDTTDDFETRNFANMYELWGQLVKDKIIDLASLERALKLTVVYDWDMFAPFAKHFMERYNLNVNPWENFEWLAEETRKFYAGSGDHNVYAIGKP